MTDSANPDALIGVRLGSCLLEKPLGVGGMGTVYLARQERPHRPVAVKVLRPQLAADPEAWRVFLARFKLEADATAALDHANIVPIYEFGEVDDLAYLVMPFLADGSLAALLAHDWILPIPRALRFAEHAAAALDYAHQHGIVHRDVKPSNLLLHPDGRLLLADFGIARLMDRTNGGKEDSDYLPPLAPTGEASLTQTGSAMGTPEYMSPEQVRGEAAGAAADIYALGIVTYVMLAGRSPFAGGDVNTVLQRQLADPPLPLRPIRGEVTTRMEEVIFWALAKDPTDRPATAGEFAQALAAAAPRARTLGATLRRPVTAVHSAVLVEPGRLGADRAERQTGRPSMGTLPLPGTGNLATADAVFSGGGGEPPTRGGDATLHDGAVPWPEAGSAGAPPWPVQPKRAREMSQSSHLVGFPLAALAAAVVALILVATLVFSSLAQNGLGGSNGAPGTAHNGGPSVIATSTSTATPQPTATSTPYPANWLAVSPQSVSLSCRGKGTTKYVTLSNRGPDTVQWQAQITPSGFTTPLTVRPESGQLDSGEHISIALTTTSYFAQQGQVTFTPGDSSAGQPAVVTYSINSGCI
ncbi:MAG TPA: serine/threonine-protein kinase [Ktedonobacterales bacterium]|nr:serine/threonine-protein kinase [Ktedonobacterales bacterium]